MFLLSWQWRARVTGELPAWWRCGRASRWRNTLAVGNYILLAAAPLSRITQKYNIVTAIATSASHSDLESVAVWVGGIGCTV